MSSLQAAMTAAEASASQTVGTARRTWQRGVIAAATGTALTADGTADLAAAMRLIGYTSGQFSEESTRLKAYLSLKARCDALPTPAESEAEYRRRIAELAAKRAEFETFTKAMRAEIDGLDHELRHHGHADARLRQELAAAEPAVTDLLFLMSQTAAR